MKLSYFLIQFLNVIQFRRYLTRFLILLVLVYFLTEPVGEEIESGTPIHYVTESGEVLNVIAPTVVSDRLYTRAESIGSFMYGLVPDVLITKVFNPGVPQDQGFARDRGLLVANYLFPSSESIEMVHPANVRGASSTLAWALASIVAGNRSLGSKGTISATGTLFPTGIVGSVGSVGEKVKTPQVLDSLVVFTPEGQASTAYSSLYKEGSATLPIGVSTLEEAVGVLCVITLSKSKPCDRFNGAVDDFDKKHVAVSLNSSNFWLCTSIRFSSNPDINKIGCSRVFEDGRWKIQISALKDRY